MDSIFPEPKHFNTPLTITYFSIFPNRYREFKGADEINIHLHGTANPPREKIYEDFERVKCCAEHYSNMVVTFNGRAFNIYDLRNVIGNGRLKQFIYRVFR